MNNCEFSALPRLHQIDILIENHSKNIDRLKYERRQYVTSIPKHPPHRSLGASIKNGILEFWMRENGQLKDFRSYELTDEWGNRRGDIADHAGSVENLREDESYDYSIVYETPYLRCILIILTVEFEDGLTIMSHARSLVFEHYREDTE